jgi:predicted nucleic-acid-binding protein
MNAVDTNILIRFLIRDDEHQANLAYGLFKQTEQSGDMLFVPIAVVLEMIWVLESAYDVTREEIIASINDLLSMPIFMFETQTAVQKFVVSARQNNFDLSDLLLAHSAAHAHCNKVYTFDKKASQYNLFELLAE